MSQQHSDIYDFVIVGSGLGGLVCACILAKEGRSVLVLEKNHQIGGTLQVFSRDKAILDTGVHYLGSIAPGQTLHRLFSYLEIMDELKLQPLDPNGFDVIRFADGSEYQFAQGYPAFQSRLTGYFPDEAEAISYYIQQIRKICTRFPLYNLEDGIPDYWSDEEFVGLNAYDFIAQITTNERLRNVLAGCNSFLYAGEKEYTPFYVHALIMNSYIEGAWRMVDGGSQIAIALARKIRQYGGVIKKHQNVKSAVYSDEGLISSVVTDAGDVHMGRNFISNLHPSPTIDIFGKTRFPPSYVRRVQQLPNTISAFSLHLVLKENSFPYLNHNIYQYETEDVWDGANYLEKDWPTQYFVSFPATSKNPDFAESISIMTCMRFDEVAEWADSFNTIQDKDERSSSYQEFKREKEERIIAKIETLFPGIREHIKSVHSSSPLTLRDYIGSPDGTLYGVRKDAENPLKSLISTKTRIKNLHLTGQNTLLHGLLGVSLGALVTCFSFVDRKKIIQKITDLTV